MATYDDRGLLQGYFDMSCMISRFSGHVLGILWAILDAPWAHGRYVLGSFPRSFDVVLITLGLFCIQQNLQNLDGKREVQIQFFIVPCAQAVYFKSSAKRK